jgi:predicted NBD/HSP70 family sugar kinase
VVYAPNYAPHGDWTGLSLAGQVERVLGISTVIENDANALALLEQAFGDNAGLGSSAVVVLDEGVGCGIISNHRLVHGFAGAAGEIGHLVVAPKGPRCRCGNQGCLESVAGAIAIIDAVNGRCQGRKAADLGDVARLVELGNAQADEVVQAAGEALGRGLSALLNLANPERVVLYGPVELVGEADYASARTFMAAVREASGRYTFSTAGSDYELLTKPYEYGGGARAAAAVALLRTRD